LKRLITYILLALTVLFISACGGSSGEDTNVSDLKTGTVFRDKAISMDDVYIPTLFYTNFTAASQPMVNDAKASFNTFLPVWNSFYADYANYLYHGSWKASFATMNAKVLEAQSILDGATTFPADIEPAHAALEEIRYTLKDLREEYGVSYFIDYITAFHDVMEPIAIAVKGKTASDIPALIDTLTIYTDASISVWTELSAQTIDYTAFNISTSGQTYIANAIAAETANLNALKAALTAGTDNALILQKASSVKPLFLRLFFSFGNFITAFETEMIRMEQEYIAPLFYTNNAAAPAATIALAMTELEEFESAFNAFAGKFAYSNMSTAVAWNTYFDACTTAIANARTILTAATDGSSIVSAHEELEAVRNSMKSFRTLLNVSFPTDYVTAYHGAMEPIALEVKDITTPAELTPTMVTNITTYIATAKPALIAMSENVTAETLSGFTLASADAVVSNIAGQVANMNNLEAAIAGEDNTTIFSTAKTVKPTFIAMFKMLGQVQ